MKKQEAYPFIANEVRTRYEFVSIGPKGRIVKVVEFYNLGFAFNLAFGDSAIAGDFDDNTISDNGDMREVLQTIANIIHQFSDNHPGRPIYIEPVDRRRRVLYNRIFKDKIAEISDFFEVVGIDLTRTQAEKYKPSKTYDAFLIEKIH